MRLNKAVRRNPASAILLSGGLDTSILAFILSSIFPKFRAFSISLEGYGDDLKYVQFLSSSLGISPSLRRVGMREAFEAIPEVIRIRRSFDPALPNDLAIYLALKWVKEEGVGEVMTGDGADELFAGYSYMFDLNLEDYIPKLAKRMSFSSNEIGFFLGIKVRQPFLDKEVVEFALSLPPDLKVREEGGRRFGKWVLRKSFEGFLPPEIVWQSKRPIEVGTGFAKIREIIGKRISDSEFEENGKRQGIKFISKDHLFYFRIYREVVGGIPKPEEGERGCPCCGAGLGDSIFHCRTCGWSR